MARLGCFRWPNLTKFCLAGFTLAANIAIVWRSDWYRLREHKRFLRARPLARENNNSAKGLAEVLRGSAGRSHLFQPPHSQRESLRGHLDPLASIRSGGQFHIRLVRCAGRSPSTPLW